ncbi:MAG: DEAD/DEAH box helicase [Candidatus Thorarchaeota archaeon]
MRITDIKVNRRIIAHLEKLGFDNLFPPQAEAFKTGVLEGKNLVLAVPTSSGKTLVAEICMIRSILDGRGKALYLVPLKSLAREKYNDFRKYEELGITVAMSVGDYDSPGVTLRNADIIVLTTEKADSLIRHKTEWLDELGIVVVDEVHLINDVSRGPTLEMVLAKLIQTIKPLQVVALSATISNADQMAQWLKAELVLSSWRPVPLTEGVYSEGKITFNDGSTKQVPRLYREELANIVCDTLEEEGQVLLFVSNRRSTVSLAKRLAPSLRKYISDTEMKKLKKLAKMVGSGPSLPEASVTLARVIASGIAFHHAGLDNRERALVEEGFKENLLKVIVATPTLAAGVNLPARRVIIRDYRRFEASRGSYPIPVLEYKQMAGRAGRPKYDEYGEAVLIARNESEGEDLFFNYIEAEPEDIESKLASPRAIRFHLLASIASEMTQDQEEINQLVDSTFFSYQFERYEIDYHILSALEYLESNGLILDDSNRFTATPIGRRASQLYIDPETAILFRDILSTNKVTTIFGLLHLICHSPDQPTSYVTRAESDEYIDFVYSHVDDFLVPPPMENESYDYMRFLGETKTARILNDWIDEVTQKEITERHRVGMGDVHRFTQSANWLVYAASEIARIIDASHHIPTLRNLRARLKHGVRDDILELVSLRGIGRTRGRMLHNYNLRTLSDLHAVDPVELAQIPTIGTAIAKSIKKQLGVAVDMDVLPSEDTNLDEVESVQTLLDDFL